MCGIVGTRVFAGSPFRVSEAYIERMRDTMLHRGPDGAGTWVSPDERVGLGHRRLSIVDLSTAANQPMANEDGALQVVFNGEIYNHAELRGELERIGGHRWKTDHSDTEVILHAFEQWGIECLHRFRGMFAFALWDGRQQELWLVRDRLGIKPLYYSLHHGRIVFASEIKALLEDPEQTRAVDEEAFFHYLSFLTTPAPTTLFAGIRKLPAGTWLRVSQDGDITESRYWDVWRHTSPLDGLSDDDLACRLRDELRTAVRLRKMSDVPVGVFLSGGIDSSTNAALFAEGETRPIKTFSIGYAGDHRTYQNELHFARQMAERVGSEHYERLLTEEDLLDFLPRMIQLQDEPIADPVCMPVYYVSELARQHGVVVCQVGEGSDELFWGYEHWKLMHRLQRGNDLPVPRVLKRLGLWGLSRAGRGHIHPYEWLRRGTLGQRVFWGGCDALTQNQKQSLLSPAFLKRHNGLSSWSAVEPIYRRFRENAWEPSILHWMSYVDLQLRLPELLLMRVDKMSMGTSIECRVPFLDHKFVELALSIPERAKIRHGVSKYLMKKAATGLIPDELIHRRKQGFGVPVYEWLSGRLGELCRQELRGFCRETDYLNWQAVETLLDRRQAEQVWPLLNFALWWRQFVAGEPSSLLTAAGQLA